MTTEFLEIEEKWNFHTNYAAETVPDAISTCYCCISENYRCFVMCELIDLLYLLFLGPNKLYFY